MEQTPEYYDRAAPKLVDAELQRQIITPFLQLANAMDTTTDMVENEQGDVVLLAVNHTENEHVLFIYLYEPLLTPNSIIKNVKHVIVTNKLWLDPSHPSPFGITLIGVNSDVPSLPLNVSYFFNMNTDGSVSRVAGPMGNPDRDDLSIVDIDNEEAIKLASGVNIIIDKLASNN